MPAGSWWAWMLAGNAEGRDRSRCGRVAASGMTPAAASPAPAATAMSSLIVRFIIVLPRRTRAYTRPQTDYPK
jgi:hypothetical protein